MARTLAFTYASLTIGAGQSDSNYNLTGKYTFRNEYPEARLSFEVVISATSAASFLTSEATLLAAYRKPDQDLTVTLGGSNRHVFSHSSNTGFNARPTIEKIPGPDNTDRSARYRCSVTVQLPADLSGRSGRLDSTVDVSESPSGRKTLTVTGVYTALSSNSARDQYEAAIATYVSSITTGLGGTWETVESPQAQADDQDKRISFRRVLRELKHNQGSSLNETTIVDPQIIIRKSEPTADSSPLFGGARPLEPFSVDYSCSVPFSVSTDLKSVYENTVRNRIVSDIQDLTGAGTVIITQDQPGFDPIENRLVVSVQGLLDTGSQFYQLRVQKSVRTDLGVIFRPVWDGNPFSRDRYDGPASEVLEIRTVMVKAAGSQENFETVPNEAISPPEVDGYTLVRKSNSKRQFTVGIPGYSLLLSAFTTAYFYVRADQAVSGSSPFGNPDGGPILFGGALGVPAIGDEPPELQL